MTKETEELEIVRGSGNVFRDAGFPNANVEQAKALLAAQIIKVLRTQNMTNRAASKISGVTEADISRIKQPDLKRFTIDRLMTILNKLDPEVDIKMEFKGGSKRPGLQQEMVL
ncbi:MAG: XRE family transcriptional regulator [Nitrospinae bacterium]|nr:XRE family transcriptional regulator [Nitrospinota bacterium]